MHRQNVTDGMRCVERGRRSVAFDYLLLTYFSRRASGSCCEALPRGPGSAARKARGRGSVAFDYLLLTYFSRRICGTGSPYSFSVSKQASTMFGLPHR
jgi:hypothetical protein